MYLGYGYGLFTLKIHHGDELFICDVGGYVRENVEYINLCTVRNFCDKDLKRDADILEKTYVFALWYNMVESNGEGRLKGV